MFPETIEENTKKNREMTHNYGASKELRELFAEIMRSEDAGRYEITQMIIDRQKILNDEFAVICGLDKEIKGE
jgi:hypothetical protein